MDIFHISGADAELLRKHYGYSRAKIAEDFNCSASTIKNWENKTIVPPKYNEFILNIIEPHLSFDDYREFIASIRRARNKDKANHNHSELIKQKKDISILIPLLETENPVLIINIYQNVFLKYGFVSAKQVFLEVKKYYYWGLLVPSGFYKQPDSNFAIKQYWFTDLAREFALKKLKVGYSEKEIEKLLKTYLTQDA